MKKLFTILFAVLMGSISTYGQLVITNTTDYDTFGQMLLANEINESGEPFAEALGYDLDELDPMVPNAPDSISYTMGIENYEYSRYQLATIVSQSGMGLHMVWAPVVKEMAAMITDPNFDGSFTGSPNGFNEDDLLMMMIGQFGARANQTPPANAWPQFAEFQGGDPHLPQPVEPGFPMDFSSLHWDRSLMDKTLNPGAMGQAMMKQYLWAQDMLSAFHDGDNEGIDPDGTITPDFEDGTFDPDNNVYYGGDNADGFIGQVLTAEAINKARYLIGALGYNGSSFEMIDPASYDPANGIIYFPHAIAVTETQVGAGLPPEATTLTVTDGNSHLWDQLSILWATLNFKNMMQPGDVSDGAHIAYRSVFDGDPFPASMSETGTPGPFDLMMGTSKVVFLNMMAMHYNADEGTFVDLATLDAGGNLFQGNIVSAESAGYTVMVLAKMVEEFAGTPLETMALNALNAQTQYLIDNLIVSGNVVSEYEIGTGPVEGPITVEALAATIRGLYAATTVSDNSEFPGWADLMGGQLIESFYVPEEMTFKTTLGDDQQAVYTPYNVALITGALREANLVGEHDTPEIFTRFFKVVGNGMQLCEAAPTGETGNDSDGDGVPFILDQPDDLPMIFASEAVYDFAVGIKEYQNGNELLQLTASPNPADDYTRINFYLEQSSNVQIEILDFNGRKVGDVINQSLPAGENIIQWNTSDLPAGTYLYRVITKQAVAIGKLSVL